jgi:hypothetical protein
MDEINVSKNMEFAMVRKCKEVPKHIYEGAGGKAG